MAECTEELALSQGSFKRSQRRPHVWASSCVLRCATSRIWTPSSLAPPWILAEECACASRAPQAPSHLCCCCVWTRQAPTCEESSLASGTRWRACAPTDRTRTVT
eukprot:scaffold7232_cov624-Prasinococcus_capsulatus_cf.AAC.1